MAQLDVVIRGGTLVDGTGVPRYQADVGITDGRVAGKGRLFVEELLDRDPALKDRTLVATGDVRPTTERALEQLGLRYVRKPFNLRDLRDEAARVWAAGAVP